MSSGRVVESGPETKKETTKSSSEMVNASSAPAMMPGINWGSSTRVHTCTVLA